MNILLTGGSGYIATSIINKLYNYIDCNIVSISRKDFDLTNTDDTNQWFTGKQFDVVIHTAITGGRRTNVQNSGKMAPSESDVLDQNLLMYFNLIQNKNCFNKFICFGSGVEVHHNKNDSYSLSKKVINQSILNKSNYYNIRMFGVFDHNEQNDRFIKSCILKYINKMPMVIFKNKKMDFFYMDDVIKLLAFMLTEASPPKVVDCTYSKSLDLYSIATIINTLCDYTVPIETTSKQADISHVGQYTDTGLNYIGLEDGIRNTYDKLKLKQT